MTRIVSNTEVTQYNTCKRSHRYRFGTDGNTGIEPRLLNMSYALYRGIIGHEALAAYYQIMQSGFEVDDCRFAAMQVINKERMRVLQESPEDFGHIEVLNELSMLLEAYSVFWASDKFLFTVVAVEEVYTANIALDLDYGMRLDLLVRFKTGLYKDELCLIDHKFSYNFKTPMEMSLDAQLPKYVNTLRKNGLAVKHAWFNQIRYRSIRNAAPNQIFKRDSGELNKTAMNTIWDEQRGLALELSANPSYPYRNQGIITCRGCYFQKICNADLKGEDTTLLRKMEYRDNSYGYVDLTSSD